MFNARQKTALLPRFRDRLLISFPPSLLDKTNYPITFFILFSNRHFLTYPGITMPISDTSRRHAPDFHAVSPEDWQNQTITHLNRLQRPAFASGAMSLPPAIIALRLDVVSWTASGSSLTPAARLPMRSG